MRTYEVHFRLNGRPYVEQITTTNSFKARQLIKARYPDCQITRVEEV
jgi:hypothetical protein